jgi:hypothetical protein
MTSETSQGVLRGNSYPTVFRGREIEPRAPRSRCDELRRRIGERSIKTGAVPNSSSANESRSLFGVAR